MTKEKIFIEKGDRIDAGVERYKEEMIR